MTDYRKATREYIDRYMDIQGDVANGDYTDIHHLAEFLIDTIDVDFSECESDEEYDAELDRHRIEIYDVLIKEHADEIYKGQLIHQILDAFWEDKELMEMYNNNIWDVCGDLYEIYDNAEDLEQINKNLGGKEVKKEC